MAGKHEALKRIRLSKGLTQNAVAVGIGISQANYAKKERGDVAVTLYDLERVAEYYGVHVGQLFLGQEENAAMEEIRELSKMVVALSKQIDEKDKEIERLQTELNMRKEAKSFD